MTTPRTLPDRPSWESIRKQAKKLARDTTAESTEALARARSAVPGISLPLTQRDAQLIVAREYGFAGWQDLRAEVLRREGNGLAWAAVQARRAVHDDDVERLRQLVAEYPDLLSWRDDVGDTLLLACTSFANDSAEEGRERTYNRPSCAEFLIDAGSVDPTAVERVIRTGAAGMLRLLWAKGVLPRTLPNLAALGDLDGVRASLDGEVTDPALLAQALLHACRFSQAAVAYATPGAVRRGRPRPRRGDRPMGRPRVVRADSCVRRLGSGTARPRTLTTHHGGCSLLSRS